jgi:hypothetical protein
MVSAHALVYCVQKAQIQPCHVAMLPSLSTIEYFCVISAPTRNTYVVDCANGVGAISLKKFLPHLPNLNVRLTNIDTDDTTKYVPLFALATVNLFTIARNFGDFQVECGVRIRARAKEESLAKRCLS